MESNSLYHIFISLNDDYRMGKSRPTTTIFSSYQKVLQSTLPSLPCPLIGYYPSLSSRERIYPILKIKNKRSSCPNDLAAAGRA